MDKRKQTNTMLTFAPRTYWAARGSNASTEAEIVRIALSSSGADAVVLTARLTPNARIRYRMTHVDSRERARRRISVAPASSAKPLTLGELIDLLENACYAGPCPDEGDDARYGGVIWGTLRLHMEHGLQHADDYLFFLKVTSRHYPQLERHYAERLNEWCLANCVEDDDCGKVVRLRTGRFARKLMPLAQ
jgi:hypothetical protein